MHIFLQTLPKKSFYKSFQKYILILFIFLSNYVSATTLVLTSDRNLTLEQVIDVASNNVKVELSPQAKANVQAGYNVVMQAALNAKAVYGLTVGVGWNKDRPVFKQVDGKKELASELIELSKAFNLHSLRAHASGYGNPIAINIVRAAMLIRLNTFLNGEAGVSPQVANIYVDYLNHGITPVVPEYGSVGEADITLASHIGLAMVGEWDVFYQGKIEKSADVMAQLHIDQLVPFGKDFLSILSNNSLMAASAVYAYQDASKFYNREINLFALSLQGFNGNLAAFSNSSTQIRPYDGMKKAAQDIRSLTTGSSLNHLSDKRALQDALSYRSMAYSMGSLLDSIYSLKKALTIQINHTDDNPVVLIHGLDKEDDTEYMQQYFVDQNHTSAIVPTSNFNFLPVTQAVATLNLSLAKVAEVITQQIIRTQNPELTKLPRFLASAENQGHAFGAIQKPFSTANYFIKQLAQPQWINQVTIAGNIEDTSSMSNITLANNQQIYSHLYVIAAYQLLHTAQEIDLRKDFKLSAPSKKLYDAYRQVVPFFQVDAQTTKPIAQTVDFIKGLN